MADGRALRIRKPMKGNSPEDAQLEKLRANFKRIERREWWLWAAARPYGLESQRLGSIAKLWAAKWLILTGAFQRNCRAARTPTCKLSPAGCACVRVGTLLIDVADHGCGSKPTSDRSGRKSRH